MSGHSNHYVHVICKDVVSILNRCVVDELIRPLDTSSAASTMSTLGDVKIVVDTTFVPLPKSPFKPTHYHGNSPTKVAWKYEVAV